MSDRFICFLETNYGKHWSRSVLGKKYQIRIEDRDFTLHFPKLPDDWSDVGPLSPPNIVKSYLQGGKPIYYGSCTSFPKGYSVIEKVVITTEVDDKEKADQLAIDFDAKITLYAIKFLKYIQIISNSIEPKNRAREKCFASYNYETNGASEHLDPHSVHEMNVFVLGERTDLPGNKTVLTATRLLESETQIPMPYEYYLGAVEAYEEGDNRKCILDAATASEMCITDEIRKILREKDAEWKIDDILDNYQGLNKKFEFLKAINGNTASICSKNIYVPRNKAIHAGAAIDTQSAVTALAESRKVLDRFIKFWE